jgi:magnesium-transporting ATPase (P-type)
MYVWCCWCCTPQVFDIPFNSANKWSLAVTSCPGDSNHQLVMMKGAPEIILTKCSHHLHNKQEKEIDEVRGLGIEAASKHVPCQAMAGKTMLANVLAAGAG